RAFVHTPHLVRHTKAGTIDHATAMRATHAARRIGHPQPLRVAWAAEATATTLALRGAGHTVTLRHGVASDAVRVLRWTMGSGRPGADSDAITDYTPFGELDE